MAGLVVLLLSMSFFPENRYTMPRIYMYLYLHILCMHIDIYVCTWIHVHRCAYLYRAYIFFKFI